MILWLLLAAAVVVPWAAVIAVALSALSIARYADERHDAMVMHPAIGRPCPLCHVEGAALVDPDGVALCTACRCSYEVATL